MLFKPLTKDEIKEVETTINQLLDSDAMTIVLKRRTLIKIKGDRSDVYLVLKEDIPLLERLSSKLPEKNFSIVHARIKLGFFIHEKFLIAIESISFLSPLTRKRISLDTKSTQKFIYGKDVVINTISLQKQIEHLEENATIMVFSDNNIPLGYAKVFSKEKNPWLQNLVDVGIFLRSEKSAF
ncbi:MAG: hypothetical protein JSU57_00910 [Candidatus Heimdallarchaeota archaeon]|nr:MAG: hypothetical protein JSU57_00910 [Candidatus Heimdallarchaeota archaeon]